MTAAIPCCAAHQFQELWRCLPGKINASLYFSDLCRSPVQLQTSFVALEELRRLRFLYTGQSVLHEKLLYKCNVTSGFQIKKVSNLVNLLKTGQLKLALRQWHSIFNDIRQDRFADFYFAVQYIGKQLGVLYEEFGLERQQLSEEFLHTLHDVCQLHSYMEDLFARITESSAQLRREQLTSLIYRINEYIYAHYTEESLSVQQIADHLGANAAYLNRQFREVAGMSIGDAIHHTRIAKARQLLKETSEPVELIAQNIGYINTIAEGKNNRNSLYGYF